MLIISVGTGGEEADERQRFAARRFPARCWLVKLSLDFAIDMEFLAMEDIVVSLRRCMVEEELNFTGSDIQDRSRSEVCENQMQTRGKITEGREG